MIMRFLLLAAVFPTLLGLALLMKNLMRINLGEGFFLSVSVIVCILFGSGKVMGTFTPGFALLLAGSAAGFILQAVCGLRSRRRASVMTASGSAAGSESFSFPVLCILLLMFAYAAVLFYGAFLQNPDDLHWYGPVLSGMAAENRLPEWNSSLIPYQPYAASLFELFFLKIAGSSEHVMYTAAFFLNWIGFLLPMAGMKKKDLKAAALYSVIVFASLYSLYSHPYKSLYVDLPCIAWAGGLAGWWPARRRGRKKTNILILLAGLLTLFYFKKMVGLLMVLLVILYVFFEHASDSCPGDPDRGEKRSFAICIISAVLFLAAAAAAGAGLLLLAKGRLTGFLPASIQALLTATGFSMTKMVRLAGALGNSILGTPLHGKSDLDIYPFAFLVFLLIWQTADRWFGGSDRVQGRLRSWYLVLASAGYTLALAIGYIIIFAYEEAVAAKSAKRYLSIVVMYLFLICLSRWIRDMEKDMRTRRIRLFASLALLFVFITGWNDVFIANATSFNKYQVAGSEDILEAGAGARKIRKLLEPEDRVYFLNQSDENELPQNTAICYLLDQVSNFALEPWRFTEDGCVIRAAEKEEPVLEDLPQVLEDGGYTYVWIYRTDEYLSEQLPEIFDGVTQVEDSQLYRVTGEDGSATGLELVSDEDGLAG